LQFQIQKRGDRGLEVKSEFRQVGTDTIIGSASWIGDGGRQERFQVTMLREGEIVDMRGCKSMREAERYARRRRQPAPGCSDG
jgi:hypothetical protein